MFNKFIYFIDIPISERYINLLGIETVKKNGYDIEIWDFSDLIWEVKPKRIDDTKISERESITIWDSKADAKKGIKSITKNALVISILRFDSTTYWVYRSISKAKLSYAGIYIGSIPNFLFGEEYANRAISLIKQALRNRNFRLIKRYVDNQITYRILRKTIKESNYILTDAMMAELSRYPNSKRTKLIWAHTLDYETYLLHESNLTQENASSISENKRVAVFLDQWLPFHSDPELVGVKNEVSPENYYRDLNFVFEVLEKKYNFTVLIAAHPKSLYEEGPYKEKDYYRGRRIEKNNTLQLVKESSLVLAHISLAINYAVLYNRPILFITTDEIDKTYDGRYIELFADAFGKKVINAKSFEDVIIDEELVINEEKYAKYKENYIKKKGTPEKEIWQIFIDEIKQGGEKHL